MDGKLFTLSSEVARAIAAQRQPKQRRCVVCAQAFATIGRGLYCGRHCKRAAEWLRIKARARAAADGP